ncbi:putative integral membrane protein TIGR02587 [Synechococcus sp. PCC 7335]|uniref:TIGR02587 family membrane protein n=1 Tax=Synechococcus sp. (strain ATCC 29403 / PCC 7335) TaxID=91464 RepID=UPI00017EC34D|nr:TIGR02587 family membrane protein [Synechococcus sp. PCC 7335]EDX87707.1 putative integral membrane protein TIGR02587 [Synechococcus sp. PCC 7335]
MASSKRRRKQRHGSSLRGELNDLVRGLCGGFLFGIPLLYTMEVWWIGSSVSPPQLAGVLLTTLLGTYLLSRTGGFRKSQVTTEREAIEDAIEALALGIVCALSMLVIFRQITFDTRLSETIGQIVFESVPFSFGVALANQFLRNADSSKESDSSPAAQSESPQSELSEMDRLFPEDNLNETISDIGATLLGALIVAFSIAPTDEVTVLVAAIDGPWLMLMVFVSLLLSYGIVFQANFTRQEQRRLQSGLFQKPVSETVFSYLLSLSAAALMLGFFGKIDISASVDLAFKQILILGLPATIGGAAGRLVV